MKSALAAALALAVAAPSASAADKLELLKDLQVGPAGSSPQEFVKMGEYVYFTAYADAGALRLFRTDGTAAGTTIVAAGLSAPQNPGGLTVAGGTLFFTASSAGTGYELWKSDGTNAGTVLVKDIVLGPGYSLPTYLTAMGREVYFRAIGTEGTELWKSNGTADGTVLVADTRPEMCPASMCGSERPFSGFPEALTVKHEATGDVLYWLGQDSFGFGLWRTTGTPGSFERVVPGSLSVVPPERALTEYRGDLYFVGKETGKVTWGLWKIGSQGTVLVKEFFQGPPGPGVSGAQIPANLIVFDDRLYFTAWAEGLGNELWVTEGTEATTEPVADIAPGSGSSDPYFLIAAGSLLYFVADDGITGAELWRTDGTASGTFLVEDICPYAESNSLNCGPWIVAGTKHDSSRPYGLTAHEGKLYFSAYDPDWGRELFRTDGTTVELVMDFFPGSAANEHWGQDFPNSSFPGAGSFGRLLYIVADDGEHGVEPWILKVLTPAEEVGELIGAIEGLVPDVLKPGQGSSLIGKLDKAREAIEAGDVAKAVTMLQAFIHQVRAFENARILDAQQAADLVAAAQALIDSIT